MSLAPLPHRFRISFCGWVWLGVFAFLALFWAGVFTAILFLIGGAPMAVLSVLLIAAGAVLLALSAFAAMSPIPNERFAGAWRLGFLLSAVLLGGGVVLAVL